MESGIAEEAPVFAVIAPLEIVPILTIFLEESITCVVPIEYPANVSRLPPVLSVALVAPAFLNNIFLEPTESISAENTP